MTKTPASRAPIDHGRINTHNGVEVEYWCHRLHLEPEQLKEAVREVGHHAEAVEAYVRRYTRRGPANT